MGDIADADAVSELIYRLGQSAEVSGWFGDGAGAVNVSGDPEGPWPHIVVTPAGTGDLRGMNGGSMATGVQLEFISDPDRTTGQAELWRRAIKVIAWVCALPEQDTPAGRPVLCHIYPSGYPAEPPLTSGQYRVTQVVMVVIAPPQG